MNETSVEGRVQVNAVFECRDKDGNIVKTIELTGSVPLAQLTEPEDGTDNRE